MIYLMKFAILLTGLHHHDDYQIKQKDGEKNIIDYRLSFDNFREMILNPLKKRGDVYDIYLSTNTSGIQDLLIDDFSPVNTMFENIKPELVVKTKEVTRKDHRIPKRGKNVYRIKNIRTLHGLEMIKPDTYDLVLLTRFDLIFKKKLTQLDIRKGYFNLLPVTRADMINDDNFMVFDAGFIPDLITIIRENQRMITHYWVSTLVEKKLLVDTKINYMCTKLDPDYYVIYRNRHKPTKPKKTNPIEIRIQPQSTEVSLKSLPTAEGTPRGDPHSNILAKKRKTSIGWYIRLQKTLTYKI